MTFALVDPMPPQPGESLPGLVMRNAARYHFADVRRLLTRIRSPDSAQLWTLCAVDPGSADGEALRTLLGLDAATFGKMSPWTGDPTSWAVMGHPMWRDFVRANERTCCPACMATTAHHRSIWNLDAMPVCAEHAVWLRRTCHGCGAPLSWQGPSVCHCSRFPSCAAAIADAPADPVASASMGGIKALHALLTGTGEQPQTPQDLLPQDVFRLSFVLGRLAFGYERDTRPLGFVAAHRAEMPDILDAGWAALADWPNGFHAFLDSLKAKASSRKGKAGLRKAFGTLSTRIHRWAREPRGAAIGEAFANYAAAQPDLATTAFTIGRYAPGAEIRHRHITMVEARRALGVSMSTIARIARRRNLYVLPTQGAGTPSLMRADVFRELQNEMEDFISPESARRMLGVGLGVMQQLEQAGLVQRLPLGDLVLETKPFRRPGIAAFVAACQQAAPVLERTPARKLATPMTAVAPGRAVPDICRALLDGRLRTAGVEAGQTGLRAIRLSMPTVQAGLPSSKETLSLLDAGKRIGVKYPSMHFWVKRGLLEVTTSDRPEEHGIRVAADAWDRFVSEYATSGMLADEIGQGRNTWITRHLKFLGIAPVSGEEVDGGYTNLFRRRDLGPSVDKAIRRLQNGLPGSPQDKHRDSFARVATAAAVIAGKWGAKFTRQHNLFADRATGRAVQVISGRRPDLTGVFSFHVQPTTLAKLAAHADPWVALVPNHGDTFLLLPAASVPWRGGGDQNRMLSVRLDGQGKPLEMADRAMSLAAPPKPGAAADGVPRAKGYAEKVALEIAKLWGVTFERCYSQFAEVGGDRIVHVAPGRKDCNSIRQFFTVSRPAYDRLCACPDAWLALLPKGDATFALVPFKALNWHPYSTVTVQASVNIDADGKPMGIESV